MNDEIKEGQVLSWNYEQLGTNIPPIRYKIYTIKLLDSRIVNVKEEKILNLEVGNTVLVILPKGNITQAYLSEVRNTSSTSTIPYSEYLQIIKML